MSRSRNAASSDMVNFWFLMVGQAVGSQVLLWRGLPVYRRLLSDSPGGAGDYDFVLALLAIALMQVSHWKAFRIRPGLRFPQSPILGRFFLMLAECSFFFASSLAVMVLFDHTSEVRFVWWKFVIFAIMLYTVICYKYQLGEVGEALIEGPREK